MLLRSHPAHLMARCLAAVSTAFVIGNLQIVPVSAFRPSLIPSILKIVLKILREIRVGVKGFDIPVFGEHLPKAYVCKSYHPRAQIRVTKRKYHLFSKMFHAADRRGCANARQIARVHVLSRKNSAQDG